MHDAIGLSVCPATSSRHRAQRLPGHLSNRQSTRAANLRTVAGNDARVLYIAGQAGPCYFTATSTSERARSIPRHQNRCASTPGLHTLAHFSLSRATLARNRELRGSANAVPGARPRGSPGSTFRRGGLSASETAIRCAWFTVRERGEPFRGNEIDCTRMRFDITVE